MARLILLLLLIAEVAYAQTELLKDTSAVVVVTAQRQEVKPFDLAESVSVLTQKELQQRQSRSTPEALMSIPGVWMQKTNHGGGSPFVRGLTGNQTLLLLDGIRLNNSTYRYGPNQYFNTISVQDIDQIEVVRGGGSVLYGSDAIGGTINVLTHNPKFADGNARLKTFLLGRVISQGMEQSGGAGLEFSGNKAALFAEYSYRDFGDLIAGGDLGKEVASSYQEQAASAKLKVKFAQRSILTLAYNGVFQSEVGRYDQVAQNGYQVYQFDPQNRQLAYAKMQWGTNQAWWQKIELTASWQHSNEVREKLKENAAVWQNEQDEVTTLGLSLQVHSLLGAHWGLISGLETYWDQIKSKAWDWNPDSGEETFKRGLYPNDAKASNLAAYTSLTAQLNRLRLNSGLRYNFFRLRPNESDFESSELSPQALVGNVSVHYRLARHHALIASASTAFRAPNINDLSSFGPFDFGLEVPAPNLKPEQSLNLELGYKFQNAVAQANLSLFRIQLYDLINRIRGTYQGKDTWEGQDVYLKANTASAYIHGLEWESRWWVHPKWSITTNMTYTYGQDVSKEEPMRRIPPLNGSLALYCQASQVWSFGFQTWGAALQDRLSGGDISDHRITDGGTPGWIVSNLNIGFSKDWLQINGGIQNLFNEAYRIHGSGVDGMGRSFWLGLRVQWD